MNQHNLPKRMRPTVARLLAIATMLAPFGSAHAYVGPGLGLGTVMVILGFIGSVLLAVFGIFWYPIKRALKKRKAKPQAQPAQALEEGARPDEPEAT